MLYDWSNMMVDYTEIHFLSEADRTKYKVLEKDTFDNNCSGKSFKENVAKLEVFLENTVEKYSLSKEKELFLYNTYSRLGEQYRLWQSRGIITEDDGYPDMQAFKKREPHARNLLIFYNKELESTTDKEAKKRIFNKMILTAPTSTDEDKLKLGELFMRMGDFLQPNGVMKLRGFGELRDTYNGDDMYILSARYSSLAYNGGEENSPVYRQMQKALDKVKDQRKIDNFMKKTINVRFVELVDIWKEQKSGRHC